MADKTLTIKNNGTGTLTLSNVTIGNSAIATYNSSTKKISIVGAGTTNSNFNMLYTKGSVNKSLVRSFNITGKKSQLQTLQEEYSAAVAALTDIQNWFKKNTVKVIGEVTDTLTFTYINIPTTWATAITSSYTTFITSEEAYFTEHGEPTYDYTTETLRLYFVYENNRYRLKKLFNYYAENRYGGGEIYNDREINVTSYTISPSLTPVETLINNLNTNGVRELSAIAKDILSAM